MKKGMKDRQLLQPEEGRSLPTSTGTATAVSVPGTPGPSHPESRNPARGSCRGPAHPRKKAAKGSGRKKETNRTMNGNGNGKIITSQINEGMDE